MGLLKNRGRELMNRPRENPLRSDDVGMVSIVSSSDSEDDDVSSGRYTALPQDALDNNEQENSDSEESSNGDEYDPRTEPTFTDFDQSTKLEVTELWNSTNARTTDIIMDPTKVEQIKTAMAGFKLPITSIPPWAEQIPEEEWKQKIINKVHSMNN